MFHPDSSPANFITVYQYTLVEYGVGKPRKIIGFL
ncbi:MAG: hypothetical protein ACHBN1_12675 [Heteroscytonema crispum UTEX LB 1556]